MRLTRAPQAFHMDSMRSMARAWFSGNGVSTTFLSTNSPALAAWLRQRFEDELGPEYEIVLQLLAEARQRVRSEGSPTEDLSWQQVLDSGMLDLVRAGQVAEARERLQACLSSSSD